MNWLARSTFVIILAFGLGFVAALLLALSWRGTD